MAQQWNKKSNPDLFHPVIFLPDSYPVFDLSKAEDILLAEGAHYGVGRYNEQRTQMYKTALFGGVRNIHMGIDIFAPVDTPIYSFTVGTILLFGNNGEPGDYGNTLVMEYKIGGQPLYALYGHLSAKSLIDKVVGQKIQLGQTLAWVGDRHENGGWTPHLHFQLALEKPSQPDLPGVVSEADHFKALLKYPDPRIVLGPIYI